MKRLLIAFAVIIAIAAAIVFGLPYLLSTDTVRAAIRDRIEQATGYKVDISGPVNFAILPWVRAEADTVRVEAPSGDFTGAFQRLDVAITPMSLFSDRIEITGITLVGPRIALAPAKTTPGTTAPAPSGEAKTDRFANLVSLMEKLSVKRIAIEHGTLVNLATPDSPTEISNIDLVIEAPDLDGAASFSAAATMNGRRLKASGNLSALRPILTRQPAKLALELSTDPAFVPAAPDIKLTGTVKLDPDGYYRVNDGVAELAGMSLRYALLYEARKRPYLAVSVAGDTLDLDRFRGAGNGGKKQADNGPGGNTSLAALRDLDGKIDVQFNRLTAEGVTVAPFKFSTELNGGIAKINFDKLGIAGGDLSLDLSADVRKQMPVISGLARGNGLDITALAKIAGREVPAKGKLGLNLGFAARGLDAGVIAETLNAKGTVSIAKGAIVGLPEPVGAITGLDAEAKIDALNKPVTASGTMMLRGEQVRFSVRTSPNDFIAGDGGALQAAARSKRLEASFNGTVRTSGRVAGKTVLKTASLNGLMTWLGQPGAANLGPFAFDGNLNVAPNQIAFNKATVSLKGQTGRGSGSVRTGGHTVIKADMAYDTVDIAALAGTSGGGGSAGGGGDAPVDLAGLRAIDADISLAAKTLVYGGIKAGPARTRITVAKGVARMNVPDMGFYGGKATMNLTADGTGKAAAMALKLNVSGTNARAFLLDAADFGRLEGRLDLGIDVTTAGGRVSGLKRNLAGNARFRAYDGAIRGIDVAKLYRNLGALAGGKYAADDGDKTTFTEFGATFAIAQGIAHTDDLKLAGPLVRMTGRGDINVPKQTLAFRLDPKVVASLQGQGSATDVAGIGIPIIVEGPWANARIYPDLSAILQNPQAFLNQIKSMGIPLDKLGIKPKTIEKVLGTGGNLGDAINAPDKAIDTAIGNAVEQGLQGKLPKNPLDLLKKKPAPAQQPVTAPAPQPAPETGAVQEPAPQPAETAPQQQNQDPVNDLLNQGLNSLFKQKQ